jgi:hypothetical protein
VRRKSKDAPTYYTVAPSNKTTSDDRETKSSRREGKRRDRVAPESPRRMKTESASTPKTPTDRLTRRKSKSKSKGLRVDVPSPSSKGSAGTPNTAASTPSPVSVRNNRDLRSPGIRKSPKAKIASENDPLPDFVTQTDRFGNASTPRNSTAIQKARVQHPTGAKPNLHVGHDGKLTEEKDDLEACTETLVDSLRLMCCCLVSEVEDDHEAIKTQETEEEVEDAIDRPRLLPRIHPDDHGKKCLVLDLDETLVHSSFRAVPGADFVIPVQVCLVFFIVRRIALFYGSLTKPTSFFID